MKKLFAAMVSLVLLVGGTVPVARPAYTQSQSAGVPPTTSALAAYVGPFRTRVALPNSTSRARLDRLGVVVLEEGSDWAVVLADADQLETLARLRFEPQTSDDLGLLVEVQAETEPWLAQGLQPLLTQASRLSDVGQDAILSYETQADLRAAMQALTPEQQAGIAALTSVDGDADGLTDTQELWWCMGNHEKEDHYA